MESYGRVVLDVALLGHEGRGSTADILAGSLYQGHQDGDWYRFDMGRVDFTKGEEIIIKGLRFVVAVAMRSRGILILKLKESHESDHVESGAPQDRGPQPGAV